MNKTLEDTQKELDSKIPRDVISLRDGGGGRKLSYLEGWYVIDRLNKIFGPLGWSKQITDIKQVVNTTSRGEFPAYLVKVKLSIHHGSLDVVKEAYGYGADKSSQNAHELAIKEAVTDALKVAAKDLGMSLGLALYDKEQTNVDDGKRLEDGSEDKRSKSVEKAAGETKGAENKEPPRGATTDPNKQRTLIRSYHDAAVKKIGTSATSSLKAFFNEKLSVSKLDEVPDDKLKEVLDFVKGL